MSFSESFEWIASKFQEELESLENDIRSLKQEVSYVSDSGKLNTIRDLISSIKKVEVDQGRLAHLEGSIKVINCRLDEFNKIDKDINSEVISDDTKKRISIAEHIEFIISNTNRSLSYFDFLWLCKDMSKDQDSYFHFYDESYGRFKLDGTWEVLYEKQMGDD